VKSHRHQPEYTFDLSGGDLSLDFANTVSRRTVQERRADHLTTYDDLVAFFLQSKVLSVPEAERLRNYGRQHQEQAKAVLQGALEFREVLYRAFSALAAGSQPRPSDLREINNRTVQAMTHRKLVRDDGRYRWHWRGEKSTALERLLWPISQAAADLLTSSALADVRECDAADCAWLFLDHSRNRSRRWCDMKTCGNREKARRHYQREHE
jgi:predicted RNA-binding Zn ribbon-like protein